MIIANAETMQRFLLIAAVAVVGCRGGTAAPDMAYTCDVDCWCPDAPLPAVVLSTTALDFGDVSVGSSADAVLTVSNIGSTRSAIPTAIWGPGIGDSVNGPGTFPGGQGTCKGPLEPGDSCTLVWTFAPTQRLMYRGFFSIYQAGGLPCGRPPGGGGGGAQAPTLGGTLTGNGI